MNNLAFDAHRFVTDLARAGMKTSQAEVLADHYANHLSDRIATKDDLKALERTLWIRVLSAQFALFVGIVGVLQYLG